jgi:AcrR family transcriptional regulator
MPRTYTKRSRAESMRRTRYRIIEAARSQIPTASNLSVDAVAAGAGVSVQTLYTHFGSKRGLLMAVIDSTQRDVGLYADFERVWSSPDGETALRRMLEATFRLWAGAWPLVGFSERVRRTDPEIERYMREVDGYRLANLRSITDQLGLEGRLRAGIGPDAAADLTFAMSMPSVYQQLVLAREWPLERALVTVSEAVVLSIVDPAAAAPDEPADWSSVLRPTDAISLGDS